MKGAKRADKKAKELPVKSLNARQARGVKGGGAAQPKLSIKFQPEYTRSSQGSSKQTD